MAIAGLTKAHSWLSLSGQFFVTHSLQKYIIKVIFIPYFAYLTVKLLKNLHLFYLNRFVRMFPLLATAVLLQVGVLHYILDGPVWTRVASNTEVCRTNWWKTLLFVQNYFLPMVCTYCHSFENHQFILKTVLCCTYY